MPRRNSGGRPPKYNEPSRPITVTLPESALQRLQLIDEDKGQAIVTLAKKAFDGDAPQEGVKVVEVSKNTGLLVIGRSAVLARIPFLRLVEVAPGRCLLAIDSKHDFRSLELALHDLLDEDDLAKHERSLLEDLLNRIRALRRSDRVSQAGILLVTLDPGRAAKAKAAAAEAAALPV